MEVIKTGEYVPYLIIGLNALISIKGFNDTYFYQKYLFRVESILRNKEYIRLISSGFLHGSWTHIIFNMMSLYFFSQSVLGYIINYQGRVLSLNEMSSVGISPGIGIVGYCAVFIFSLIGGNMFSLWINRNQPSYSAIGASGAVSGVIFAAIALDANASVGFFFIPIPIPGWVYALGYTLYSIYGIRAKSDNIGHEAHLGGGVVGMLIAIAFMPEVIITNYLPILLVLVPTIVFVLILVFAPHLLNKEGWLQGKIHGNSRNNWKIHKNPRNTVDEDYNEIKREKEQEVDRILDKISKKGIESLTRDEKNFLDLNT